jgi:hypothetical protein
MFFGPWIYISPATLSGGSPDNNVGLSPPGYSGDGNVIHGR